MSDTLLFIFAAACIAAIVIGKGLFDRRKRLEAEAIRAKAETEASERLDGLNEERDALVKEVADLKAAATDYRAKFEALLQAQQEALEKASDLF